MTPASLIRPGAWADADVAASAAPTMQKTRLFSFMANFPLPLPLPSRAKPERGRASHDFGDSSNHTASLRAPRIASMLQGPGPARSEEHPSELQSLMRISYAVFGWKKKTNN